MMIDGFQKVTLLDFPNKVSCILFTRGCNLKCPFCQNSSLIGQEKGPSEISEEEIFAYLEKRKGILDGVVISGGEPLLQRAIKDFIRKIKAMGLLVKLDTNGSNPKLLKELVNDSLIDYVAMDIKNDFSKYGMTVGKICGIDKIKESIEFLKQGKVNYEFRTTIVKEFHTIQDISAICGMIGTNCKYYIQNFEDSDYVIDRSLHGFSMEELIQIDQKLKGHFPNIQVRALT